MRSIDTEVIEEAPSTKSLIVGSAITIAVGIHRGRCGRISAIVVDDEGNERYEVTTTLLRWYYQSELRPSLKFWRVRRIDAIKVDGNEGHWIVDAATRDEAKAMVSEESGVEVTLLKAATIKQERMEDANAF